MDSETKETYMVYSTPPYVDPVVYLGRENIDNTIQANQIFIEHRTKSDYHPGYFEQLGNILISSIPFLGFLAYLLYPIVLAGYNCGFENTNLGWIRASFFLNIPFVLLIFFYIITMLIIKKMPSCIHLAIMVGAYAVIFLLYSVILAVYGEAGELIEINKMLHNATAMNLLPCSRSYYVQVFAMAIINLSFFCLTLLILLCAYCMLP